MFSRLARAGYAVVPHRKTDFTVYERMIGLDRFSSNTRGLIEEEDDEVMGKDGHLDSDDLGGKTPRPRDEKRGAEMEMKPIEDCINDGESSAKFISKEDKSYCLSIGCKAYVITKHC